MYFLSFEMINCTLRILWLVVYLDVVGFRCVICSDGRGKTVADVMTHISDEHLFCPVCVQPFGEVHLFLEHAQQHTSEWSHVLCSKRWHVQPHCVLLVLVLQYCNAKFVMY